MDRSRLLTLLAKPLVGLAIVLFWASIGLGQSAPGPQADEVLTSPAAPGPEQPTADSAGSAPQVRSYIAPVFRFMETVDSNPQWTSGQSSPSADSMVSGDLAIHQLWHHASLNVLYQGGAAFYSNSPQANTWFQQVGVEQTFMGRRSTFSFGDHFNYLPDSGFGFSGFGFYSYPGMQPSSNLGTGNLPLPVQSILTPYATRYDNMVDGAWQYRVTARSTVSFFGSYDVLRFPNGGFFDSDSYGAGASYDHQLGQHSSLGASYTVTLLRYSQSEVQVDADAMALEYKRSLGKRYALQLGAGPQYVWYDFGSFEQRWILPSGHAGLTAQWNRVNLSLMYAKAVTAGSGVALGAKTDSLVFTAGRRLNQRWQGSANVSYAHNSWLQPNAGLAYDSEGLGLLLSRSLGRTASFFMQYGLQNQNATAGAGSVLAGNLLRHFFGVGLSWGPRPLPVSN
jgi:hypothetical protein